MPTFGDWETYVIRQSTCAPAPDWFTYGDNSTFRSGYAGYSRYYIAQSFHAYQNDLFPYDDIDARLCALKHASEGDGGSFLAWDPGVCPALGTMPHDDGGFSFEDNAIPVGTSTFWQGPPLYLLAATYQLYCTHSGASINYAPLYTQLGPPFNVRPTDDARIANPRVLAAIPPFLAAAAIGIECPTEILRVDGEAHLAITTPQGFQAHPLYVTAHDTTRFPYDPDFDATTPVSGLGPVAMGIDATYGATSATLYFPDMQEGEYHQWDFCTDWLFEQQDPGLYEDNYAYVELVVDFVWTIRVKPLIDEVKNVCRWRNRDDGLGMTAAARQRTGTSLQRGLRQRGYR